MAEQRTGDQQLAAPIIIESADAYMRQIDRHTLYIAFIDELGFWFIMKMSYRYRIYHNGDSMTLRPSYLHRGISCTSKTTSYWIRPQKKISAIVLWRLPASYELKYPT